MKKLLAVLSIGALMLFVSSSVQALPLTLNFDTDLLGNPLSDGDLLNDVYGGLGVAFNASAAIRTTGSLIPSVPNFATGSGSDWDTDLVLTFDTFATSVGAANVANSSWTLTAFDEFGGFLGSISSMVYPSPQIILDGIGNIKTAVFSTDGQYGIDDLVFDTTAGSVLAHTPEPATVFLLGLGMLGMAGYRHRRRISLN